MLARTHKSLMLVNHYNFLANSTTTGGCSSSSSSALRPLCFIPFQLWSQRSLTDDGSLPPVKPSTSKDSVRVCESDGPLVSKKLFVVSSSKSLPTVNRHVDQQQDSPAVGNPLPPKPSMETQRLAMPGGGLMEQLNRVRAMISTWINSLRNLGWKEALLKVKDQMAIAAGALVAPGNVERARQGLVVAWNMSVSAVQSLMYWIRVFLDSREYFYLRYYTLLLLENAVHYARLGLASIIQMVRNLKKSS